MRRLLLLQSSAAGDGILHSLLRYDVLQWLLQSSQTNAKAEVCRQPDRVCTPHKGYGLGLGKWWSLHSSFDHAPL